MLKVHVAPPAHLSQAMHRVGAALARHAPAHVEIVSDPDSADFRVLHVIANDAIPYVAARPDLKFAVMQYCYLTAGLGDWASVWDRATTVWSYYDLPTDHLYYAPLGIDPVFHVESPVGKRRGCFTSGYVSGPGAEAIEEVVIAAYRANLLPVHLGPKPVGFLRPIPTSWRTLHGISDSALASVYQGCAWVGGLRYSEGFEMPCIEGLSCGARPIVFDQPAMRHWYGEHAIYVPECSGPALVDHLIPILSGLPPPVDVDEVHDVRNRFDWKSLVTNFWERAL